jgi:hypothetical protein
MSEVDLNIANYSLSDLLKLFKLDHGLNEEGMKQAKRQVLMMHPDKSNLNKEYFLFFSSAYKLLYKVYEFHKRHTEDTSLNRYYTSVDMDEHQPQRALWKELSQQEDFNDVFNEMFDKLMLTESKNNGYGDWLKAREDFVEAKTVEEMNTYIGEKKKMLSSIVVFNEITDMNARTGGSMLIDEEDNNNYQSCVFSMLPYDDLKHAYTESVVPVTEEVYLKRTKYTGVDHLQRTRQKELEESIVETNHHDRLQEQRAKENRYDMERAYSLAKQDEHIQKHTNEIASALLRITK